MADVIILIIGIFIALIGAGIMENAAFSDRAQLGFYVVFFGAALSIGAVIALVAS